MKNLLNFAYLFLLSTSLFAQSSKTDKFYPADVVVDESRIMIVPQAEADLSRLQQNLREANIVIHTPSHQANKGYFIFDLSKATQKIENLPQLKADADIAYTMPVFRFQGTDVLFVNEIYLELQPTVSIKQLTALLGSSVALTYSSAWHTHILKVRNTEQIFALNEQIKQTGWVKFSVVNSIANIVHNSNDPLFDKQYYLQNNAQLGMDINAVPAWNITKGAGIRVAVIDDGVEDHEDLRNPNGTSRVIEGFTPGVPNGYGLPNNLCLAIPGQSLTRRGHGQACAGIIAATQNNAIGISGVAPQVQIVPVNIFYNGSSSPAQLGEAIRWASQNADVLSNSWSYDAPLTVQQETPVREAINFALTTGRGGRGCPVIFSSGNYNSFLAGVAFPANVPGVISVGAIGRDGNITNYSSRGAGLSLVAFGGHTQPFFPVPLPDCLGNRSADIVTLDRMDNLGNEEGNYTEWFSGTSAACPQVAGAAALLLAVSPTLSPRDVESYLTNLATDMGDVGRDNTFGAGRLNIGASVQAVYNKLCPVMPVIRGESTICQQRGSLQRASAPEATNFEWQFYNRDGELISREVGNLFYIDDWLTPGVYQLYVRALFENNGCGAGWWIRKQIVVLSWRDSNCRNLPLKAGESKTFSAYPNPANSTLNLSFENQSQSPVRLLLSNTLGVVVLENKDINLDSHQKTSIDLSLLPEGIYILQVHYADGNIATQKIAVQRGEIKN